jgi:hypothetical protein
VNVLCRFRIRAERDADYGDQRSDVAQVVTIWGIEDVGTDFLQGLQPLAFPSVSGLGDDFGRRNWSLSPRPGSNLPMDAAELQSSSPLS